MRPGVAECPPHPVWLVAGEPSGDLHGASLARALQSLDPNLCLAGMGQAQMREAGVDLLVDSTRLAVVGLVEVAAHYREIRTALNILKAMLDKTPPQVLVLIDYPEFNLRLADYARRRGVKALFYISPQIWAWRKGRIKTIARRVDLMAVVLPFEAKLYEQAGVPVCFVGHPLVDHVRTTLTRPQAYAHFGLDPAHPVVGLLPGSRAGEVKRLLPILVETAACLRARLPHIQFILPVAPGLDPQALVAPFQDPRPTPVTDHRYDALALCDAAITASGTATLELALLQIPMSVTYRLSALTYLVARRLVKLPWVSLVNIVANRAVVREFLQDAAQPQALAVETLRLLTDQTYAGTVRAGLSEVITRLGPGGSAEVVAGLAQTLRTSPKQVLK